MRHDNTTIISCRRDITAATDERVKQMTEIISAIRLIKLYCWEKPFAGYLAQIREKEIAKITRQGYLKAVNYSFSSVANRLMLFASLVVFVVFGGQLDAEKVFVVISLFNILRVIVTEEFPYALSEGSDTIVALERIKASRDCCFFSKRCHYRNFLCLKSASNAKRDRQNRQKKVWQLIVEATPESGIR